MLTRLHCNAQAWFKVTNRFVLVEHRIWSHLPSQMCLVPCAWSYVFDQERMLSVTTLWLVILDQCKQANTTTGNHAEMIHHISDCCVQLQAVPPHAKALSQDRCDISSRRGQLAPSLLCGTAVTLWRRYEHFKSNVYEKGYNEPAKPPFINTTYRTPDTFPMPLKTTRTRQLIKRCKLTQWPPNSGKPKQSEDQTSYFPVSSPSRC